MLCLNAAHVYPMSQHEKRDSDVTPLPLPLVSLPVRVRLSFCPSFEGDVDDGPSNATSINRPLQRERVGEGSIIRRHAVILS